MTSLIVGGAKGGGATAARTPVVDPDTLVSRSIVEVIEAFGWGEIEGFPDDGQPIEEHIYLDGTPLMANGNYNFKGVTFEYRKGLQAQDYIPGSIDGTGSPVSIGVKVEHSNPIVRTVSDPEIDAVQIVLTFVGIVEQDMTTGDRKASQVYIQIEVRPAGGAWVIVDLKNRNRIRGKTESPYQRSFHVNLREIQAESASYDIRVSRMSADPASNQQSEFSWDAMVLLTYAKLRRPNIAYCRLTFDARYFTSIPSRSYDLLGWKVMLPTPDVYDPVARAYTGADWSGSLVKRWSRNPAWFLYHLLITAGAGLGAEINPAYQDKWAIYQIAKRCDEPVPDGKGGYEPRYSIDAQFMTQASAYEMIQQISGIFDAQPLWSGSSVYLAQDAPKPVSAIFLPANVVNGRFAYSSSARQVRYTAALIQYNDPTDQYRINTEYVEDFSGIQRYGYRPVTETAVGCTSRAQAHRRGKRLLTTSRLETDSVSFSSGLSGMNCKPGDVIRIADPLRSADQRLGGRVASGSTVSEINIDAPVELLAGIDYRFSVIGSDGAVQDVEVTNTPGTYSQLSVYPSLSYIEPNLEWLVYDPLESGKLYRILSVIEEDDNVYSITGIQYDGSKFAEIDDIDQLPALPTSPFISVSVIPPSGLQAIEGTYTALEGIRRFLDISWSASTDKLLRGYQISYKHNGQLVYEREIVGQSFRIDNPLIGDYEITLSAVSVVGVYSVSITITYSIGELFPVEAIHITDLSLPSGTNEFTGKDAFFSWSTDAQTVLGSEYAAGAGGQTPWFRDFEVSIYSGSILLRREYTTASTYIYSYTKNQEDGLRRTFTATVKARDFYGRYSQSASLTATNPPPSSFGAITLTPGIKQVFVTYVQPSDPDYVYTRIYASKTQGFTPSNANLVGETVDRVTVFPTDSTGVWYVKLQGVDEFGVTDTVYSDEISTSVFTVDVTASVDEILANPGRNGDVVIEADRFLIVKPGESLPKTAMFGVGQVGGITKVGIRGDLLVDGSIAAQAIAAGSVTAEKITVDTLSAVSADLGTVTAGTLKTSSSTGWRVEISANGDYPIWYGFGTKNAGNAKFYLDKTGDAFFGGQISVGSRFRVLPDGTCIIKDGFNRTIFSSGSSAGVGIDWGDIGGVGKPEDNATFGATFGGGAPVFYAQSVNYQGNAKVSGQVASSGKIYSIASNDYVKGTVPKLLASIEIAAGAYSEVSAVIGCVVEADTAKIELRYQSGQVIKLLQHTGPLALVKVAGFELLEDTLVNFYLIASSTSAIAVSVGINVE